MAEMEHHIERTPTEARQGSRSKDTFVILLVSTAGAVIALLAIWIGFQL
ncbi:MAG: hypothetical protein ABUS57_02530 [Pseudomonadota bacterium]